MREQDDGISLGLCGLAMVAFMLALWFMFWWPLFAYSFRYWFG